MPAPVFAKVRLGLPILFVVLGCASRVTPLLGDDLGHLDAGLPDSGSGNSNELTCTIGGSVYSSRESNPADRAQCCNPRENASGWTARFTKGGSYRMDVPADLMLVDMNGDGWPDVVIGYSDEGVVVFLNNGNGTFNLPETFSFSSALSEFTVGDLNGDGFPDIIVGLERGANPATLAVRLNDGAGGFGREVDLPATCYIQRLTVGDLNGDGWPDVLAGENAPCGPAVFLNDGTGDGGLGAEQIYSNGSNGVASIGVGDFNGDGLLDFATDDGMEGGSTSIYLNGGRGTFGSPIVNTSASSPHDLGVGKLGPGAGDDLVVTDSSQLAYVIGQGLGGLTNGTRYEMGGGNVAVADIDGDGLQDVVTDDGSGNLYFLFNQGDGGFWPPAEMNVASGIQDFAVADLNGDGAVDVAITVFASPPTLTIWYGGCP